MHHQCFTWAGHTGKLLLSLSNLVSKTVASSERLWLHPSLDNQDMKSDGIVELLGQLGQYHNVHYMHPPVLSFYHGNSRSDMEQVIPDTELQSQYNTFLTTRKGGKACWVGLFCILPPLYEDQATRLVDDF